jgi:uncharacterized membrane protein
MSKASDKAEHTLPAVAQKNIESIAQIEQEYLAQRTPLDRVSDAITRFVGSMGFIIGHAIFFTVWMTIGTLTLFGMPPFDPYPWQFLNLVVALETVFLSTFVLMSQNRQNRHADQWAHLHLQVALLAERESTKMLQMLQSLCAHVGLNKEARDKELKEMIETTHVEVLAEELEKAREQVEEATEKAEDKAEAPQADKA